MSRGLQDIAERYKDQTVVLVAHGFVAKVIRAVSLTGFGDFFDWKLDNGAVLELCISDVDFPTDGTPLPPT